MVRSVGLVALSALLAAVLGACNSSSDATTTSTSEAQVITTLPETTTTTLPETTTTLAPVSSLDPPAYQIVGRAPIEGQGDEVVVLLDPTSYDSLTDLDIYDLIGEVVELFPPVSVLHLVDDPAAANVVANPDASEAEREVLTDHYLARLEDGATIVYLGPFSARGTIVLGS